MSNALVTAAAASRASTDPLGDAFESAAALYTAATPHEAATIAAGVLRDTVASDWVSVYLYDVNEDVMRQVLVEPGAASDGPLHMWEGVGRAFAGALHRSRQIDSGASSLDSVHDDALGVLLVRGVCARGRLRAGIVVAPGEGRAPGIHARVLDYVADRLSEVLG